jgi:hypothetical protein
VRYADLTGSFRAAYHNGEVALGQSYRVHVFDRGTTEKMRQQGHDLRRHLLDYLDKHYELGMFSASALPCPDPYGGYEVFLTYYGEAKSAKAKARWKQERRKSRDRSSAEV